MLKYICCLCLVALPSMLFGAQPMLVDLEVDDAYEFPVSPGSLEWKGFQSRTEKLAVCVIPEDYLVQMSTRGLLETCINFPFSQDMMFYNTIKDGLDRIIRDFNGLQALITRPDCGHEIAGAYMEYLAAEVDMEWPLAKQGEYGFVILFLETLLARSEVLSSISDNEILDLLRHVQENSVAKSHRPNVYGTRSLIASAYLSVHLIKSAFPEMAKSQFDDQADMNAFMMTSELIDDVLLRKIETLSRELLIGEGGR